MLQATDTASPTVKGLLLEHHDDRIVLALPGTDYQLHLALDPTTKHSGIQPLTTTSPRTVTGAIHAVAKRVDVVHAGGRYIEPVYGRPRRLQGTITAIDPARNALTVYCGCPFVCTLSLGQKAHTFELGQLVSFDVERGATFRPL